MLQIPGEPFRTQLLRCACFAGVSNLSGTKSGLASPHLTHRPPPPHTSHFEAKSESASASPLCAGTTASPWQIADAGVAEGGLEAAFFDFPKTRRGNQCRTKLGQGPGVGRAAALGEVAGGDEGELLARHLEAAAGLAQESTGESPMLLAKHTQCMQIINDLLDSSLAVNALSKSEESKRYLKFREPAEALARAVRDSFGDGKLLDVELLVLQESLWVCNGGFATRSGKHSGHLPRGGILFGMLKARIWILFGSRRCLRHRGALARLVSRIPTCSCCLWLRSIIALFRKGRFPEHELSRKGNLARLRWQGQRSNLQILPFLAWEPSLHTHNRPERASGRRLCSATSMAQWADLKRHYETFAKRSAVGKASVLFGVGERSITKLILVCLVDGFAG